MKRLSRLLHVFLIAIVSSVASAAVTQVGQANVGSSVSASVTIPLSSVNSGATPTVHVGTNFATSLCTITPSGCQVTITFSPRTPGSLSDALLVKDNSGTLLGSTNLHGTGLGPHVIFNPANISAIEPVGNNFFGGLAVDPAGRVFFGMNASLYRLDPGSSTPVLVDTSTNPIGRVVSDPAGFIYFIHDYSVERLDPNTNTYSPVMGFPIAFDPAGNAYIVGNGNVIQQIDLSSGALTKVVAGGGSQLSSSGDGGLATAATLWAIQAIAFDSKGNLYIAQGDWRVRKVDATTQIITTFAGTGTMGDTGDGGAAVQANIGDPTALTIDPFDNVFIGDSSYSVRRIDAVTQIISTFAGAPPDSPSAAGQLSNAVQLGSMQSLAFDPSGNLYASSVYAGVFKINFAAPSLPFNWPGSFGPAAVINEAIYNFGNQPLQVSSAVVSAPFTLGTARSSPCTFPSPIAPQTSCQVPLSYQYQTSRQNGTLTVIDNSLNSGAAQQQIPLALIYPQANSTATSLNFGTVTANQSDGNRWITLTNPTNAPLLFSSISLTGPNASEFILDKTYCGSQIYPLSNCEVDVSLKSTSRGSKSAMLVFNTNALDTPETIALTATAINAAALVSSSNPFDFGSHQPSTVTTQTLTLTNPGDKPLTFVTQLILNTGTLFSQTATTCGTTLPAQASCAVTLVFSPTSNGTFYDYLSVYWQSADTINAHLQVPVTGTTDPKIAQFFVPITPCRVADTRNPDGPFGGPILGAGTVRSFLIPDSSCGIPNNAQAYALNVTVVPPGGLSYLTLWPAKSTQPTVSTLNSDGRVKAAAAIVASGSTGGVNVYVTDNTHVVLDISGYFIPASQTTGGGLAFYPLTPCRVIDTRVPGQGPKFYAQETRDVSVTGSSCSIPSNAHAYSLNVTVVPTESLGFLTAWPSGQTQPLASNLNATHDVTANAAIVPAGPNGAISLYTSDPTDVIVDINGYFAPPGGGGLSFYGVTPCRSLDTRYSQNYSGPTTGAGPAYVGSCGVAANSQAVVLNSTVVPTGGLGYLTLWNSGPTQPAVSTLNSGGAITSNLAIVPTLSNYIGFYASDPTYLIFDVFGYFAP